jgi:hypothetical protein
MTRKFMSKKVGVFWFDLHVEKSFKKVLNSAMHFNVAQHRNFTHANGEDTISPSRTL